MIDGSCESLSSTPSSRGTGGAAAAASGAATAGIGGAAGVSALMAAGASVLMAGAAGSGGGEAAVSVRCGGRRVQGAGGGATGASGLTATGDLTPCEGTRLRGMRAMAATSLRLAVDAQALDALNAQQPQRVQRVAVAQQLLLAVLALQLRGGDSEAQG